jgi:DNA-directed RNA polymerase subunit M/transcription elongation factor TFIIS
MSKNCNRCGEVLIPDPIRRHWAHCPKCSPKWAEHVGFIYAEQRRREFEAKTTSDTRGRPTIGGEKV